MTDKTAAGNGCSVTYGPACAPFLAKGWHLPWLRPLVPPGATLVAGSSLKDSDIGKQPGKWLGGATWAGMVKWGEDLTADALPRLLAWPTSNVGVLAAQVQAVDCDIHDPVVARMVREALAEALGLTAAALPSRYRTGSARFAAPVQIPNNVSLPPWQVTGPGGAPLGQVEFLTGRRHWVIAGRHPDGDHYTWPLGIPEATTLPVLDQDRLQAFQAALQAALEARGYSMAVGAARRLRGLAGASLGGPSRVRLVDLPPLLEVGALERLLDSLPCDQDTVGGHNEAVRVLAALAAVLGPAGWPTPPACLAAWCATYPGEDDQLKWFEDRWASLRGEVERGMVGVFLAWVDGLPGEVAREVAAAVRLRQAREVFQDLPDMVAPAGGEGEGERERLAELTPDDAAAECEAALEAAAARYFYREHADEWVEVVGMQSMTPAQFNNCRAARRLERAFLAVQQARGKKARSLPPSPSRLLLPHAMHVSGMTYLPGAPRLLEVAGEGPVLNRWRPARLAAGEELVTEDDIRPYLDVLEHVLPLWAHRQLWLDLCAHLAQQPGVKLQWCLVLLSELEGTGKDTLLLALREAVGAENWSAIQLQDLLSSYNGAWAESQVVLVTELPHGKTRDAVGLLKAHVASVAADRTINRKYTKTYTAADRITWIATTNNLDALDLAEGERRFGVLRTAEVALPVGLARAVYAFYDKDGSRRGLQLVARYFQQRAISSTFDPQRCPETGGKADMRRAALNGTPAEILLRRLIETDIEGSLAHRKVLWGREVEEVMAAAKRDAAWRGRRGQEVEAMAQARWAPATGTQRDGRVHLIGPRPAGGGVRPRLALKVWVRRDQPQLVEMAPREVAHALQAELVTDQRHGLAEALADMLEKVGGTDGGGDDLGKGEGDEGWL